MGFKDTGNRADFFAKPMCENLNVVMKLVTKTMENIGKTNGFHHFHDFWNYTASEGPENPKGQNSLKGWVLPIVSMIFATKLIETIGKTNSFHKFHDFCNHMAAEGSGNPKGQNSWKVWVLPIVSMIFATTWELSKLCEAIDPDIMDIVETAGFTNRMHESGSHKHGNDW